MIKVGGKGAKREVKEESSGSKLMARACLSVISGLDSNHSHVELTHYEPPQRQLEKLWAWLHKLSSVDTSFAFNPHFLLPLLTTYHKNSHNYFFWLLHQPLSPPPPFPLAFFHISHLMINNFQPSSFLFFGMETCVMRNPTSPVIRPILVQITNKVKVKFVCDKTCVWTNHFLSNQDRWEIITAQHVGWKAIQTFQGLMRHSNEESGL